MENKNKKMSVLEKEKLLDQEEIIEFNYYDKINRKNVVIKDKRKIKVALMELDEQERKQRKEIFEKECPYNPKTDDCTYNNQNPEDTFLSNSEVEELLEDVLQEMADKMIEKQEGNKKLLKFFSDNIFEFTQKQLIIVFLKYYLDFNNVQISQYMNIKKQTLTRHIERIESKFKKLT